MRGRTGRWFALLVVVASTTTACDGAIASARPPAGSPAVAATASPAPVVATATPIPSERAAEIEQATTFRRTFGLRFDPEFVFGSMSDPLAFVEPFGVPLYRDEIVRLLAAQEDQNAAIKVAVDYGTAHPDEYAGTYIDRDQHNGVVTVLFTGNLSEHAAAMAPHLQGRPVILRQVKYTSAELDALKDRVFADIDWMESIPAHATGIGVGVVENSVHLDVSSADPTAVQQILAHYGLGDRLEVTSDATGEVFIPRGDVEGKVRLKNGKAPPRTVSLDIEYIYDPAIPGHCGSGDVGYGVREDGTFSYPCQAGKRVLVIYGERREELGRATVNVIAGQTVSVTIRLTKDP